jgi:ectoine hydroxylase-related dioxygenase (phytanoyl-CoA dioxygenase family)
VDRAPLDDDELAAYHTNGYVVLGRILDEHECGALLDAERRHRTHHAFALDGRESGLLVTEQLCAQSAPLRAFCTSGPHLGAVGQVLGPDVAFTHTQFITKLPEVRPEPPAANASAPSDRSDRSAASWIPLHQDDGYGQLDPPLDVTVWTALTDTNAANGCLVIVPGSHRAGLTPHTSAETNVVLLEAPSTTEAVVVPLGAGEAVLFSGLTLHGSGPNLSDAPRVGMHARYCHPSVRMVTHRNKPVLADRHSWMVLGEAPPDHATDADRVTG